MQETTAFRREDNSFIANVKSVFLRYFDVVLQMDTSPLVHFDFFFFFLLTLFQCVQPKLNIYFTSFFSSKFRQGQALNLF